ncbi:MAG: NfeD family protein [Sulfuriflexus sp.]|nr:NfeD family protein [Sulfuriflexus sp.]
MELFMELNSWHWGIIAVLLIVLEMFAPGAFMIWFGVAAAVVSIVMAIFPSITWETQFMIFAVLSVGSIYGWRVYVHKHPPTTDQPTLNQRGEHYVGRVFTLEEPVVNGLGKIKVDDSTWKIEGVDCDSGAQVRVTGVDGVVLKVEQV